MVQLDVPISDWNNRMREATMKLSSLIPEVGGAASAIIGIFWPKDKVIDIFGSIKQDIENLVNREILEKEMEQFHNEIDALPMILEEYHAAKTHEKGHWLNRWIADCIELKFKLQKSSNNVHFILHTITLALLHLSGLRERLDFGKEIYDEDNSDNWKKELEQTYHDYVVDYFPDIFKKWKEWRAEQVVIEKWSTERMTGILLVPHWGTHATVNDKVSGAKQEFFEDFTSSRDYFESFTDDLKKKMCNDAYAEMAGCLTTTFEFNKIVPSSQDPPYDKELFGCMFLGPYTEDVLSGAYLHKPRILSDNDYDVNKGSLEQIVIREYNTIDAMQFIYANGSGSMAGNASGGEEHRLDVSNKYVKGLHMGFSNGILCFVQVLYRDGTKSSMFGNRMGWKTADVVANGPPGYKLRSWSYGVNRGPSNTIGPGPVQLQYEVQL